MAEQAFFAMRYNSVLNYQKYYTIDDDLVAKNVLKDANLCHAYALTFKPTRPKLGI